MYFYSPLFAFCIVSNNVRKCFVLKRVLKKRIKKTLKRNNRQFAKIQKSTKKHVTSKTITWGFLLTA